MSISLSVVIRDWLIVICYDDCVGMEDEPSSRVHLYFSSESHIHSLRNVLLLAGVPANYTVATVLESLGMLCYAITLYSF
jgi:hypothetical protein